MLFFNSVTITTEEIKTNLNFNGFDRFLLKLYDLDPISTKLKCFKKRKKLVQIK